ncbi:MAG: PHP domain-containing protein [Legionellaceae bacterium]|nr:PHP domain-containing protein [Legionellaceae bacterium]
MFDLHCHSNFSDGILSPEDLLARAVSAGIRVLALTDHDTIDGLSRLHAASRDRDIHIIDGIELSIRWKKYDVHIIGLGIRPDDSNLVHLISLQKERRIARAMEIGDCLARCGVTNAYQKARDIAGHERVARPHFARVLINEGLVPDMKTAFKRFLGDRQRAYVPTSWISLEEAVQGVVKAGGQAVIAHPLKYKLTRTKLHEFIKDFKMVGGVGLEVVSGDMIATDMHELAGICSRFDLLASSGSDYHGDMMSRIALGRQKQLPANCVPIWQTWSVN